MNIVKKLDDIVEKKYKNWDVTIALRYMPIINDLKRKIAFSCKVLDVGAGGPGLSRYVEGYQITVADLEFPEKAERAKAVRASADKLPFPKNSFEAVLSVDMMEHLPDRIRMKSVDEMIRVGKKRIYIAFPRGKLSSIIDTVICKYYKFTHKTDLEFLNEHKRFGLPNVEEIVSYIETSAKKHNKRVKIYSKGNTNSFLWLTLLFLGFSENKYFTRVNHWTLIFLPILNRLHLWPTYRAIISVEISK